MGFHTGNTGSVEIGFNFSDVTLQGNNEAIGGAPDSFAELEGRVLNWEAVVAKETSECTLLGCTKKISDVEMTFVSPPDPLLIKPTTGSDFVPPTGLYTSYIYTFANHENYKLYFHYRKLIDKAGNEFDLDAVYTASANITDNCYSYSKPSNENNKSASETQDRPYLKNVGTSALFLNKDDHAVDGDLISTPRFEDLDAMPDDLDLAFRQERYAVDPSSLAKMISVYNDGITEPADQIPNASTVTDLIGEESGIPLRKRTIYIHNFARDEGRTFKQFQSDKYSAEGSLEMLIDADDLPTADDVVVTSGSEFNILDETNLKVTGTAPDSDRKQFSQSRLLMGMPIISDSLKAQITNEVIQFKLLFKKGADAATTAGLSFDGHVTSTEIQESGNADLVKVKVNFVSSSEVTFYTGS